MSLVDQSRISTRVSTRSRIVYPRSPISWRARGESVPVTHTSNVPLAGNPLNGFWNDRVALTDFYVGSLAGETAMELSGAVHSREGGDDKVTRGSR